MTTINKKELAHLADLARIDLAEKEAENLLSSLEEILNYFKELQKLDTKNVEPVCGGTDIKNALREDEIKKTHANKLMADPVYDAFPEKKSRYLKIPPVFNA